MYDEKQISYYFKLNLFHDEHRCQMRCIFGKYVAILSCIQFMMNVSVE
jgi:hypothetical protein